MAKILLVEDHVVVREGLRLILEESGHEIVAESCDGMQAEQMAKELSFDLIIMDYSLPGMSGLDATEKIREHKPDAKVLILTMHDQSEYIKKAVETNVDGYVLKGSNHDELLKAIDKISSGGKYFDPQAASQLFEVATDRTQKASLSRRELEVLKLAADGMTNKEIANRIGIGMYTVRDHLRSVFAKLEVSDRAQAVATALRHELIL